MVRRNSCYAKLPERYLFAEIEKRKREYLREHPTEDLLDLSIGDSALPLPEPIAKSMAEYCLQLASEEGRQGYGPAQGFLSLRELISSRIYGGKISPEEIFITDGAKCTTARLQSLFGGQCRVGLQDPAYPAYFDACVLLGTCPERSIAYFSSFEEVKGVDLFYLCSPNNPTGVAATDCALDQLISRAKKEGILLLYDAAYAQYVQSSNCPKSIYEIPHAREVAVEIGSFSKMAGFTGIRLGWMVVPHALTFCDGTSMSQDVARMQSTLFNGASVVAQAGGIAALEEEGWRASLDQVAYYQKNARILRTALKECIGGIDAPFLWTQGSFSTLLEEQGILATPGEGFGQRGRGHYRLSALITRKTAKQAAEKLHHANQDLPERLSTP